MKSEDNIIYFILFNLRVIYDYVNSLFTRLTCTHVLLYVQVGSGDQGRYMCRPSNSEPAPVMVYVAEGKKALKYRVSHETWQDSRWTIWRSSSIFRIMNGIYSLTYVKFYDSLSNNHKIPVVLAFKKSSLPFFCYYIYS